MTEILLFRICLFLLFLIAVFKTGDWKSWQKYYPTVLFVIAVNLAASFLTYHYILWGYNPDLLIKTQTTIELFNSFFMLPATTFIYLSRFPRALSPYYYISFWVLLYASLEFIDHYIIGGISYSNGWSWFFSLLFDIAMFSIIRIHYLKPILGWIVTLLLSVVILLVFNFMSGEFK